MNHPIPDPSYLGLKVDRISWDTSSTTIDTNTGGNGSINYNCGYASNPGGQIPQGFTLQAGSYKGGLGILMNRR